MVSFTFLYAAQAEDHVSFLFGSTVRRAWRSRNAMLRRIDWMLTFLFVAEKGLFGIQRQNRARRPEPAFGPGKFDPKMASPSGITMNAGPGSTISATPTVRTVPPTTITTMRLTCFIRLCPSDDTERPTRKERCSAGKACRESHRTLSSDHAGPHRGPWPVQHQMPAWRATC